MKDSRPITLMAADTGNMKTVAVSGTRDVKIYELAVRCQNIDRKAVLPTARGLEPTRRQK